VKNLTRFAGAAGTVLVAACGGQSTASASPATQVPAQEQSQDASGTAPDDVDIQYMQRKSCP
jgi:hypothetical protein